MMRFKVLVWVTLVIALSIVIYVLRHEQQSFPPAVVIETRGHSLQGNVNASVKIVVFEDLKCRFCARFNTSIMSEIKKRYIDTGKANYTLVLLAFIPGSLPAANAAYCANSQSPLYYYQFADIVFSDQPNEMLDWAVPLTLIDFAKKVHGLDVAKFKSCLERQPYQMNALANMTLAKKVMGPQVMTPGVYVNGVRVFPLTIKKMIDTIEWTLQKTKG
jgi:protein-disulfide isomerase